MSAELKIKYYLDYLRLHTILYIYFKLKIQFLITVLFLYVILTHLKFPFKFSDNDTFHTFYSNFTGVYSIQKFFFLESR